MAKIVNQKTEMVMVSQVPGESLEEYRQQSANRDLLRELAEGTGGSAAAAAGLSGAGAGREPFGGDGASPGGTAPVSGGGAAWARAGLL